MKNKLPNTVFLSSRRMIPTLVSLTMLVMSFTSKSADELVVIVNDMNPVTTLTESQVKIIYTRKVNRRWKELNKNVLPVDRKGEPEPKKHFLKAVLQMTTPVMDQYFSEREYQNQETPPVKLGTDAEVIDYVENNPGAIGYIMKSSLGANRKVKVILTLN